ncbi:MAG: hypothetical protein ACI845_002728 [Gammaproteobacteria bacterium]
MPSLIASFGLFAREIFSQCYNCIQILIMLTDLG